MRRPRPDSRPPGRSVDRASSEPSPELAERNRIVAGDTAAAEAFFRRHLDALYEFVHYRVGGDRAMAEDVVGDTFLVALQGMAGFDGRSSLYTWLCGIARNKIRAQRRKRGPALLEDVLEESDSEIHAILGQVEREPLPEWILEQQETQELVGATLSSLPPDYREVLVDKYLAGKSLAEIAAGRGAKPKAAESTLHRARLAFSRVFSLLARRRGGLA